MRLLHTMLRVGDLERSIRFYTDAMGMKLLRRHDYPDGKFTLAYLGYGPEAETAVLELTYNWGVEKYEMGGAYGHVAVGVPDVYKTCDDIQASGGTIVRPAGPMKGSTTVIAFVEDPDGYKIELLEDPALKH